MDNICIVVYTGSSREAADGGTVKNSRRQMCGKTVRAAGDDSIYSRIASSPKDPSFISKRFPTASRMIPKSSGNTNSTPGQAQDPKIVQHSAPVNIPDWSKIYRTTSTSKSSYHSWLDTDSDKNGNDEHGFSRSSWESDNDEGDEDEDGEGNMIPPHEWVARKLARRQISSFSVCEGAGRTLKGRDLSTVRNDVLTKTGFLESNHSSFSIPIINDSN